MIQKTHWKHKTFKLNWAHPLISKMMKKGQVIKSLKMKKYVLFESIHSTTKKNLLKNKIIINQFFSISWCYNLFDYTDK